MKRQIKDLENIFQQVSQRAILRAHTNQPICPLEKKQERIQIVYKKGNKNERRANKLHTEIPFFTYQTGKDPKVLLHPLLASILKQALSCMSMG